MQLMFLQSAAIAVMMFAITDARMNVVHCLIGDDTLRSAELCFMTLPLKIPID